MRNIRTSPADSKFIGELPKGCVQCIGGKKLVLFVTGVCGHSCYYCPLSSRRKDIDGTWANEVPVERSEAIIDEAKMCSAEGAGITGGDPLIYLDKTLEYIRLLKKTFGKKFHVHLYTSGDIIDENMLQQLEDAGLDELRLHLRGDHRLIDKCTGHKFDVGAEVPVIPGKGKELRELIMYLEKCGAKFLNLNELEMSELNFNKMVSKGHASNGDIFNTVRGSRELGIKLLEFAREKTKRLNVHFCTSSVKNIYQYQNRLRNRAKNILKPFERIADHCMIEKGVVYADDLNEAKEQIYSSLKLKDEDIFLNAEKDRIEMSVRNAMRAKKLGYACAVVKEMPTYDSFDVEKEML